MYLSLLFVISTIFYTSRIQEFYKNISVFEISVYHFLYTLFIEHNLSTMFPLNIAFNYRQNVTRTNCRLTENIKVSYSFYLISIIKSFYPPEALKILIYKYFDAVHAPRT